MSKVPVNCTNCGRISLPRKFTAIKYCVDTGAYTFGFTCKRCKTTSIRPCEDDMRDMLLNMGVRVQHWYLPSTILRHPSMRHSQPPFTEEDAENFAHLLEGVDDAMLYAMIAGSSGDAR